jgi:hypothetical protein
MSINNNVKFTISVGVNTYSILKNSTNPLIANGIQPQKKTAEYTTKPDISDLIIELVFTNTYPKTEIMTRNVSIFIPGVTP